MSIFPKRTVRNSAVTIHWNFNTAALKETHIYPFVRIGVKDPQGRVTMLMEKHLLALPPVLKVDKTEPEQKSLYLNKNTPLLILADYLSGAHKKEALAEILQHIQDGKHFYFIYTIPADALPGKYTLVSELYNEGNIKYSRTAADDFFFVESVVASDIVYQDGEGTAVIENKSPEKTPVRLIEYQHNKQLEPDNINAFELLPLEQKEVCFSSPRTFLCYNEERVFIPLWPDNEPAVLRNQQMITVTKETMQDDALFILYRDIDEGLKLSGKTREIWEMADGLSPVSLVKKIDEKAYAEMLSTGLLIEIKY